MFINVNRKPAPDDDERESEKAAFDTIFTRIGVFPIREPQQEEETQDVRDKEN